MLAVRGGFDGGGGEGALVWETACKLRVVFHVLRSNIVRLKRRRRTAVGAGSITRCAAASQADDAVRDARLPAAGDDRGQGARREGGPLDGRRPLLRVPRRHAAVRGGEQLGHVRAHHEDRPALPGERRRAGARPHQAGESNWEGCGASPTSARGGGGVCNFFTLHHFQITLFFY